MLLALTTETHVAFCIMTCRKYEEICAPRAEEFCFITDNAYTRGEVCSCLISNKSCQCHHFLVRSCRFLVCFSLIRQIMMNFKKSAILHETFVITF